MSTHRTPPGSTPRRPGGGTGTPSAGAPRAGPPGRNRSQGTEPSGRPAPRTGRPGKGAFARSADAPVVTGRARTGSDQPRSGPDKKARTRAQAAAPGPSGRGAAQAEPRFPNRQEDRQEDRTARGPEAGRAARVSARGQQWSRDTAPRGAEPARGSRTASPQGPRSGAQDHAQRSGHAPAEAAPARSRAEPRPRRGQDDTSAPRGEAPGRREPEPHAPGSESGEAASRGVPAKGTWLYGSHAVAAALANPDRNLRRLLLTGEAEAAMRERMAGAWPLQPERIDRARLDQLLGRDAVHGGVALLADPLSSPSLAEALARPGPVLVLDQVSDPRNVGAILRSAASFGACAVVVQDRNAPDETGVMAKAASGAMERVPLLRAVNLARTLGALKAAGLWVVGLDAAGGRLSGPALSERRVALVLGAEGAGLRRLTRETCDELAGLPMPGGMESLNVSAAAAVALYELTRAPVEPS